MQQWWDATINIVVVVGGGHGDKYGEVCCGCLCFSNPNLTLFVLCSLATTQEKERHQPQRGVRTGLATRRGCEAEERYVLAYAFLNSEL